MDGTAAQRVAGRIAAPAVGSPALTGILRRLGVRSGIESAGNRAADHRLILQLS
jgi:hypothetical protein